MRVLAVDQGTSSTKAVVVDDGQVVASVNVPVSVVATTDGGVEIDPEELWASVQHAGRAAVREVGGSIDAVGLANQGETVLAWDRRSGAPRSRAIVWQDRRATSVCDRLRDHAERLAAITGLELDAYFVAPKLVWLREQLGDTDGLALTTTDTWLIHRLTGEFVTDAATASRSLLLDLDTATWSDEAASLFATEAGSLPTVVDNAGAVGATDAFGIDAPLAGLCVDQQAALFAEACLDAGETKCTYGTGAFLLTSTGDRPVRSRSGLVGCVAWSLDGERTWCLDGQVFTVGAAVTWLEQVGLIDHPSDLDAVGGSVVDSGGVVFVPALAGLGAPFWKADARGVFTGISLGTTRAHLVHAVVEGIAAQVAWLARAVADDLGRPVTRLRVDGGLTRSHLLLQLQADLAQVPVEVYPSPDATAEGVAAFARIGVTGESPAAVVRGWAPSAVVGPEIDATAATERLAAWRAVAEATAAL
jgi:glycerol kinase